jgi:hypothetical protein
LKQDGNLGLVFELSGYLSRFRLLAAQQRFSVIPINTVANIINKSPDETPAFVQELIAEGVLNAQILPETSTTPIVLRIFSSRSDGPLAKSEQQLCQELVQQADQINAIVERARVADRKIRYTREYNEMVRRQKELEQSQAASGSKLSGGASFMDNVADSMDISHDDEDLMVD